MTRLSKAVWRSTEIVVGKGKYAQTLPVAVAITPEGFVIREKGHRTKYTLVYPWLFLQGAKQRAEEIVATRRGRKRRHTR